MEMLVDPVLVAWVPCWVVEQYERWNPYFRDAVRSVCLRGDAADKQRRRDAGLPLKRDVLSNRAMLLAALKEMTRMAEKGVVDGQISTSLGGDAEVDGDSSVAGSSDHEDDPAGAVDRVMDQNDDGVIREDRPKLGGDGHDPADGDDAWANVSLAGRLSAAGPASAAPDVVCGAVAAGRGGDGFAGKVNPTGYNWEAENVVPESRAREWQQWWNAWRGASVHDADDAVHPSDLDTHGQKFAYDILEFKAQERADLEARGRLFAYQPARVILAGSAGTGKSRVIRTIAKRRRARAAASGLSPEQVEQCCALAAPTGCASFQMKNGAATAHNIFDVPVGEFKRKGDQHERRYVATLRRLRNARLFVVDERSMLGRIFRGKMLFRLNEYLGQKPRGFGGVTVSAGGVDFLQCGDDKQIFPILDEPDFYDGAYRGNGKNLEGDVGLRALVGLSQQFKCEFKDVVILRETHRVDNGEHIADLGERKVYCEEADRFVRVAKRLADCEMTRAEHEWLCERNKSKLMMSDEGRREVMEEFHGATPAVLLMDGRVRNAAGDDGAEQANGYELRRVAHRLQKAIAAIGATHEKPAADPNLQADLLQDSEFRNLSASLLLCECARVLLGQNLWIVAGLMNGALGWVRGFVWPVGGRPDHPESRLATPYCVVVEFDEVNLGVDERGQARTFFPGEDERKRWVPIFPISRESHVERGVKRVQFPLVLAWAMSHWKAQGMTLRRARVRLGKRGSTTAGVPFVDITRVKHYRHLLFEEDFPSFEVLDNMQFTQGFRARRRYELQLAVRASETLRRYGFCDDDAWVPEDRDRAAKILDHLKVRREQLRDSLKHSSGVPTAQPYANLWPDGEPDYRSELESALREIVSSENVVEREAMTVVVHRLLDEYHLVAVKEALGSLFPMPLHPSLDNAAKRDKVLRAGERVGVNVSVGMWRVSVFEQSKLSQGLIRWRRARLSFSCILHAPCAGR